MIYSCVVTTVGAGMLCEAMRYVPGNFGYKNRIEFAGMPRKQNEKRKQKKKVETNEKNFQRKKKKNKRRKRTEQREDPVFPRFFVLSVLMFFFQL